MFSQSINRLTRTQFQDIGLGGKGNRRSNGTTGAGVGHSPRFGHIFTAHAQNEAVSRRASKKRKRRKDIDFVEPQMVLGHPVCPRIRVMRGNIHAAHAACFQRLPGQSPHGLGRPRTPAGWEDIGPEPSSPGGIVGSTHKVMQPHGADDLPWAVSRQIEEVVAGGNAVV